MVHHPQRATRRLIMGRYAVSIRPALHQSVMSCQDGATVSWQQHQEVLPVLDGEGRIGKQIRRQMKACSLDVELAAHWFRVLARVGEWRYPTSSR